MLQSSDESKGANADKSAPARIFVKDLQDKQSFHEVFLARDKALSVGKNGKPYITVFLSDSSGSLDARIWENVDALNETFQSGDMVRAKGQIQIFQGRRQAIVHRLEKAQSGDYDIADFVSASRRNAEEMMVALCQLAEGMRDPNIRQLTLDVLNDTEIRRLMLVAPAAKSIHHAYQGGLIEHILSICGLMVAIATHYKTQEIELDLDLLLFGAIFHDIGKVWELDIGQGISYTDRGKLIGHMVLAVELVEKKAARILAFPEKLKDLLKHIVLSHHGRVEYGSPKVPMFLEAFIVAAIDDLDSKINTIDGFIRSERDATASSGEKWSKYNPLFERYFMLRF